jgi:hypothetical protein
MSLLGWVGPGAQQARYLYWPGFWIALFFAELVFQSRYPRTVLAGLVIACVVATTFNLWIYRDMLAGLELTVEQIHEDSLTQPDAAEVRLIGYHPNGVYYFDEELQDRIRQRTPGLTVSFAQESDLPAALVPAPSRLLYCWQLHERLYESCAATPLPPTRQRP